MKITLAYPYEGHDPDETIDVGSAEGRRLLADGRARLAATDAGTVAELKAYADAEGIDVGGATRRADIEAAVTAAETVDVTPKVTVLPPVPGTDSEGGQ
jgi:hypothetical protein